jgi:predicted metal-dependent hydrolase
MEPDIAEGIRLFNTQKFFEAHEALEAVWLKAQGERKTLLHGLIQVAAAFHHHRRGNRAGFRSLLEKGCKKLERCGGEVEGLDLAGLIRQLVPWREYLNETGSPRSLATATLPSIRATKPSRERVRRTG